MDKGGRTLNRRASPNVKRADEDSSLSDVDFTTSSSKSRDFPIGQSLFPEVWEKDPTPTSVKAIYIIITLTGLTCLCFLTRTTSWLFPWADNEWDQRSGLANKNVITSLPVLVQTALHIPLETVHRLFQATGGICILLIMADILTAGPDTSKTGPWPTSWKTDNTMCYHDMFSEPTRFGRLLRRPGNTLSNAPFLLASLCVLTSVFTTSKESSNNAFWLADAEFGIMLFLLAVTSTLWHGTNAPWSQYPDIWSMECCIFYLIIRTICMGILGFLFKKNMVGSGDGHQSAKALVGGACAVIYTAVVIFGAWDKWIWYQKGWLHGPCPFSARARLSGASKSKKHDVPLSEVAIFASMPVLYIAIPVLIQGYLLESTGSSLAGDFVPRTLVIGWTYRLFDRWVLDGCPIMNYFVAMKPSLLRTIGAAIFSPTGALHFFTGFTLLAAYVHTRSLEQSFETIMN